MDDAQRIPLVAKAIYDSLLAADEHVFATAFDLESRVSIDGAFDLAIVADILLSRLKADGIIPSQQRERR